MDDAVSHPSDQGLPAEPQAQPGTDTDALHAEIARLRAQLGSTAPPTVGQETDESQPYRMETWNGYPQYACKFCLWSTFDEGLFWEHLSSGDYRRIHVQDPAFRARWAGGATLQRGQ